MKLNMCCDNCRWSKIIDDEKIMCLNRGSVHYTYELEKIYICGSWEQLKSYDDLVNHPSHYTQGKYEVIDIIEDATTNLKGIQAVCLANVLKYILRFQYKNGIEDLKKAQWYLNKLIKSEEKTNEN